MNKLLFTLAIITCVASLHGMESSFAKAPADRDKTDIDYSKLPPITLPLIYQHFSKILLRDVAQHIFSLQPGSDEINRSFDAADPYRAEILRSRLKKVLSYGHCYAIEWVNRHILCHGVSICYIKNHHDGRTVLHNNQDIEVIKFVLHVAGNDVWKGLAVQTIIDHSTALHDAVCENNREVARLLLDYAGDKTWDLLNMQDKRGHTVLHLATIGGFHYIEIVKLLLDTAGDRAQDLMGIRDKVEQNAFDAATPKTKEFLKQYFQENNQ